MPYKFSVGYFIIAGQMDFDVSRFAGHSCEALYGDMLRLAEFVSQHVTKKKNIGQW